MLLGMRVVNARPGSSGASIVITMPAAGIRKTSICRRDRPANNYCRCSLKVAAAQAGGGGSGSSGSGNLGGGGGGSGGSDPSPGDFGDDLPRTIAIAYAVLVAVGGFMGYRKKGSQASLKASAGVAGALLLAAALIGGPYHSAGLALALGANLALGSYMLKGYSNTKKVFPQAVFSAISALNSLLYLKRLLRT